MIKFNWLILVFLMFAALLLAQESNRIEKRFPAKKTVKLKITSGDCFIKAGTDDEILVEIVFDVSPVDAFEPEFYESGSSLKLSERWHRSSSGRVVWTLTVPAKTEIDFSSASGELTVSDLKNNIEANTASGDIKIADCQGEIELSVASGDVDIESCSGEFDVSTASGDVEAKNLTGDFKFSTASGEIKMWDADGAFDLSCASGEIEVKNITIKEESSFSTASGDVEVKLKTTPQFDLELSAASGDVVLDYNGNAVAGYFELTARKHRGKIVAPFAFDKEEEFEEHGEIYMRKSFSKEGSSPKIFLSSASGKAELKK